MVKMGYENVKYVHAEGQSDGGAAMEKYFEYYRDGKIINPITGKVTVIRKP